MISRIPGLNEQVLLEDRGLLLILLSRQGVRTSVPPAASSALEGLWNYPGNHVSHLNYAQRLAEGRAIGSGQIEGACENMIGRRLKQTGARWRVRRVNRMSSLCCLICSHARKPCWNHQAA